PRQRSPRRPPGNPRPGLPRQPEPLRQHGPAAAPKTHRRLDQPAKPQAPGPSLISQTGCLIVVDTFRSPEADLRLGEPFQRQPRGPVARSGDPAKAAKVAKPAAMN